MKECKNIKRRIACNKCGYPASEALYFDEAEWYKYNKRIDKTLVVSIVLALAVGILIVVPILYAVIPNGTVESVGTTNPVDTLPQMCYPYYNDDSTRWIECMGVGYVPHRNDDSIDR